MSFLFLTRICNRIRGTCSKIYGEGDGTPLQYSCLENPMDRGAWSAAVHGVANSRTRLSDFTFTFHFHALEKAMATYSSVLAWRIPGTGEPGGLPSVGSHKVTHDWSDLAAAAVRYSKNWKENASTDKIKLRPRSWHIRPFIVLHQTQTHPSIHLPSSQTESLAVPQHVVTAYTSTLYPSRTPSAPPFFFFLGKFLLFFLNHT